ncbi:hypothetical protein EDD16DRAFT_1702670 [Pisolithus croceorrhizus]|nr:hypothetical protein EDD16DRAFT_1702670 [Pisolithus croceorrhizus]KAI6167654.1 hypothetical protein EDD17DRAFT_1835966 [Pisolithus thermaeus]
MLSQLAKDAVRLLWKIIKSNYDHTSDQSLHVTVAQLTADLKHLSEVNANLEDENKSIMCHLDVVEEIIAELQNKIQENKPTASKTSLNNHIVLKSMLQHLFCQLCGIDCDGKKNHVAALATIKPLENGDLFELLSDSKQIWHPNWLGNVDDDVNAKFIKEVTECAFNNEKNQRELMQLKSIPDTSFTIPIILECAKTYF